jgi:hypothetical protein
VKEEWRFFRLCPAEGRPKSVAGKDLRGQQYDSSCTAATVCNIIEIVTGEDALESQIQTELMIAAGEGFHDWNEAGIRTEVAAKVLLKHGVSVDVMHLSTISELISANGESLSLISFRWSSGDLHAVTFLGASSIKGGDQAFWVIDPGAPAPSGQVGPSRMSYDRFESVWAADRPVIVVEADLNKIHFKF